MNMDPANVSGLTNDKPSLQQLPDSTIRLITSSQVITSVSSVIKELIENCLDAGSKSIDIKLDNYGLDKIEVRDDGKGIHSKDTPYMARPNFTSKIKSIEDLSSLLTYGFRGEALGSLCSVAEVTISTKTIEEDVGKVYSISSKGEIVSSKPTHLRNGTTVTAVNLFKNLPVRRQFYSSTKKKKDELKNVEDLVMAFSIIQHTVRFVLRHNKETLWQTSPVHSPRDHLLRVFGSKTMLQMCKMERHLEVTEGRIALCVPNTNTPCQLTSRSSSDRFFVYVNDRPVIIKEMEKLMKRYYCYITENSQGRYPIAFINITLPPSGIDVNLEPNKTKVLFHENASILSEFEAMLVNIYGAIDGKKKTLENNALPVYCIDTISEERSDVRTGDRSSTAVENARQNDRSSSSVPQRPGINNDESCLYDRSSSSVPQRPGIDNDESCLTSVTHKVTDGQRNSLINEDDMFDDFDFGNDDLLLTSTPWEFPAIDHHLNEEEKNKQKTVDSNQSVTNIRNNPETSLVSPLINPDPNVVRSDNLDVGLSAQSTSTILDETKRAAVSDVGMQSDSSLRTDTICLNSDSASELSGNKADKVIDWSRGHILKDKKSCPIEPVGLLKPNITSYLSPSSIFNASQIDTPLKEKDISTSNSKKTPKELPGQAKLYDVIFGKSVKRPSTAFIYYAREIRPQLIQDNPYASAEELSSLTQMKWQNLDDSVRKNYEAMMDKDVQRYKKHVNHVMEQETLKEDKRTKKRKLEAGSSPSIKKYVRQCDKTSKEEIRTIRSYQVVEFSMTAIKSKLISGFRLSQSSQSSTEEQPRMIGCSADHPAWYGVMDNEIMAFSCTRAQEMILFSQLMANHCLPSERLEQAIELNPRNVGEESYQTLLGVPGFYNSTDGSEKITDDRLVKNGFEIFRYSEKDSDEVCCKLLGQTSCMNYIGINDLRAILAAVSRQSDITVSECRPLKIKHYLQSEAVRMSRLLPPRHTVDEAKDLLRQTLELLPKGLSRCFHGKPFLSNLYNLDDLPSSQDLVSTQESQDLI